MSEISDNNSTPKNSEHSSQISSTDTVSDIIRKERVTRRITIEAIARDTKLNETYIKAIENGKYDELPASPYIRVYLRSIASYLMLDPNDILEKYYKEKGLDAAQFKENKSSKLSVSLKDQNNSSMPWTLLIVIISLLAIVAYIGMKQGWITTGSEQEITTPASEIIEDNDSSDIETDSLEQNIIPDTLGALNEGTQETEAEVIDSLQKKIENKEITFKMHTTKDSVWVHIFTDGKSWRNFVKPSGTKTFKAKDSINVHTGYNAIMKYTLNGKPLKIRGDGVTFFKIDSDGNISYWNKAKWRSAMGDKLN